VVEAKVKEAFYAGITKLDEPNKKWRNMKDCIDHVFKSKIEHDPEIKTIYMLSSEKYDQILPNMLTALKKEIKKKESKTNRILWSAVSHALTPKTVNRYDLYECFINEIYEKEVAKVLGRSYQTVDLNEIDLLKDFKSFSHGLAWKMSMLGLSRVKYDVTGNKFRDSSLFDPWFKPTMNPLDKIVRDGAPLKIFGNFYAFKHKSYQEFFVAEKMHQALIGWKDFLDPEMVRIFWRILVESPPQMVKNYEAKFGQFTQPRGKSTDIDSAHSLVSENTGCDGGKATAQEKNTLVINHKLAVEIFRDWEVYQLFHAQFFKSLTKYLNSQEEKKAGNKVGGAERLQEIKDHYDSTIKQFRSVYLNTPDFADIINIIDKFPAVQSRFIVEKTKRDIDFQNILFGLLEFSKYIEHGPKLGMWAMS
jgi:hypothetical protein